jgi:hypothetical protein
MLNARSAGSTPWLPAFPSCGQNANLFNGKWSEILSQNRELFRGGILPGHAGEVQPSVKHAP